MKPLFVTHVALASALGHGARAAFDALVQGRTGLRHNDFLDCALDTCIGRVDGVEYEELPAELVAFDCRSSRLAQLGLGQDAFPEAVSRARHEYGPGRIGVFIGTSSSGILSAELGYRARDAATGALPAMLGFRETYNLFSVTEFVRRRLRLEGPAATISSACSSSAKTFAAAARAIAAGLCDAAVVGGVETLCFTTLHGFASLELLSRAPCRPCDAMRDGISIGEAAGYALVEPKDVRGDALRLLGYGETSDAYHMSAPHPEGLGAARAMRDALARARLSAHDIDYINLHGTGTRNNDAAEDAAVDSVFGNDVPCSGTKGWTGHTLGAAGAVEAILTLQCLRHGFVPGTLNTVDPDPGLKCCVVLEGRPREIRRAMSNSFGFGGSNCSLIFGRPD
ncbi:MAG: beta-ketoacyl-[acyl-carrier-protein] synthase family protein [Betaproteobacteria bacterium]